MAFETITTRAALVLVALMFSATGCGGDACASADAHLSECLASSAAPAKAAKPATCDGEPACAAMCINGAECSTLKDFYSTKPTDGSKVFLDCLTKCQSP
ncbi:MAG: hypothetical protein ABJE95_26310 [Byssovorax sp.]